jgi:hypothetical protein
LIGAAIAYSEFLRWPTGVHHSDFSPLWFSARSMMSGLNPYELIGPGKAFDFPWPEYYPATAFVVAYPFSWLPEALASALFVGISSFLLAYGVTRDGWYRLPLFLSASYVIGARAAEPTALLAASLCLPALAATYAMKPNLGLALLASSLSSKSYRAAVVGGVALLVLSFVLIPSWVPNWLSIAGTSRQHDFPILQWGGPLVLLGLSRWRRPEARLLVALACIPQTVYWYEGLYLLLIPATFRESLLLSFISSMGFIAERSLVGWNPDANFRYAADFVVLFLFLPALIMVLRRPNEGKLPAWVEWIAHRINRPKPAARH